jgi:alanine racemase
MKVFSPVISVRRLSRGEGCLYGLKKAKKKTGVSIVGYGYADGLPRRKCKRQFSNKCMDACAVKEIKKGYLAVMDNANLLAKEYGTISYEILTKSALRAEKIYYEI